MMEQPSESRARLAVPAAVAGCVVLIVLVASWHRLRLGVDLSDEAFYTALAYRFALGDRPFVDEFSPCQTAALITWPLVWLYVKIVGGSKGIVLFGRFLFAALGTATASVVFTTLRRHLFWPAALMVALVCVVFVPFSIPAPGYNALGMHFFTLGAFLCLRGALETRPIRLAYAAGFCLGLAALAYPGYAPAVVAMVGTTILNRTTARQKTFAALAAGGLSVVLLVAPLVLRAGIGQVLGVFTYASSISPHPKLKFFQVLTEWWSLSPVSALLLPGLAVCFAGLRQRPQWNLWCAPLFAFAIGSAFEDKALIATLFVITYAGLFAPTMLTVVGDDPFVRAAFRVIWWPSVFAGLLSAYTSGNGTMNGALGLFPAALLGVASLAVAADRGWHAWTAVPASRAVVLAGPAVFVFFLLMRWCTTFYRSAPLETLTVRTNFGPFAGLSTSQAVVSSMRGLADDIAMHETADGRLVLFYDLPGGYLFSRMRPGIGTVWPMTSVGADLAFRSFKRMNTGKGIAIKVRSWPDYISADAAARAPVLPLDQATENPSRLVSQSVTHTVFRLPPPAR